MQSFVSGHFDAVTVISGGTERNRKEIFTFLEAKDKLQLQSSSTASPYNKGECSEKTQVCLTYRKRN